MEVQFSSLSLEEQQLVTAAKTVKDNAYHPHSGFKFGAAVLTDSNKIFAGDIMICHYFSRHAYTYLTYRRLQCR